MGYSFVWAGEMRIFVMAACANALKVAEIIKGGRRALLWAMLTAILISAISSVWVTLSLCYEHGAINLSASTQYSSTTRIISSPGTSPITPL